jgi:protein SCO1
MEQLRRSLAWTSVALALAAGPASGGAAPRLDWSLASTDGRVVRLDDLPRKWLLVYFGYTYCPDLCPTALQDMAVVLEDLGALAERVQPVFVTIDPVRDTPAALAAYVRNFAAPILPLTGTPEAIARAARQLDMYYVRYRDPSLAQYSFDHSSSFFLIDPERRLAGDFATEREPSEIAVELRQRIAASNEDTDENTGREPHDPSDHAP